MIVIAEAGATKTHWRICTEAGVEHQTSAGYNVVSREPDNFLRSLMDIFKEPNQKGKFYLYAAGIGAQPATSSLAEGLKNELPSVDIEVKDDLFAAGRALFGNDRGVVGILGTGAALGEFSEGNIAYRVPSLGYVLGDEGGGFYLAKRWLVHLLRNQVPDDLKKAFTSSYPEVSEPYILEQTYRKPHPNQNLAQYTHFLSEYQNHPFVFSLVYEGFRVYFDSFHLRASDKDLKWRFSGSIAYYFEDILKKAGAEFDLYIDKVIQSPIDLLTTYHQHHG
jgi:glucosamine kinase